MEQQTLSRRLLSLDALRGFDMFFIMGGSSFFVALATLFPTSFFQTLAMQMEHVGWEGLRHQDTIFPLFLFIAGISFPFSLAKQQAEGRTGLQIYLKILRRGVLLVLLGCVYNGLLSFDFANMRYASVLARIGIAWMCAALLFVRFGRRTRVAITAGILIGYWLLMAFVPVPDAGGAGPFTFEGNWVGYIDRLLLPGHLYEGSFDPEGLLSTAPAIATAMLGMFTGEFVRSSRKGLTDTKKVLFLAVAGAVLLILGLVWNQFFPINKKLWSSSFVCVVAAYSVWMFALFYYIVDVLGFRRWAFFFQVIGINSITIYLAQHFINFSYTSNALFGGAIGLMPESAQPLCAAIGYIAVCWGFLYFLYRQRIFLKV